MRNVDLYGPNKAIKEAIAEATGFSVGDIFLRRDLEQGRVTRCQIYGVRIVSYDGSPLERLPELVDGFVRELQVIGKNRLVYGWGYYKGDEPSSTVTTSRPERTDRMYYKMIRCGSCVDTAYDPEEAKLFLDTGQTRHERQKGNNETDDTVL